MMEQLEEIIKNRIKYIEGEKRIDFRYDGFDFDARDRQEANKKNYDLIKRFDDLLPSNCKYVLPLFHKGSVGIFIFDKNDINEFFELGAQSKSGFDFDWDYGGWETKDIIKEIILISQGTRNEDIEISRTIDKNKRYKILKRQKWKCNICGAGLKYSKNSEWDGEVAHIDHIHPYTDRFNYPKGINNINELENLQALCPKCNLSKSKNKIN